MKYAKEKPKSEMQSVETYEGQRIEEKIAGIVQNNEPITDGAPIIFTEKAQGVIAAYNVRTDRFEVALEAMDKAYQRDIAKAMPKPAEPNKTEPTEPNPITDN